MFARNEKSMMKLGRLPILRQLFLKACLHERKKWNGSDKKWNGSEKFLHVNDTWPVPFLPVPFKKGSIGAYGPFSERNGTDKNRFSTDFFLSFPTCKRSPSFWNRSASFFPEPVVLLRQPTVNLMRLTPYIFAAIWRIKRRKLHQEKLQQKRVNLGQIMKSRCCFIRSFKNTSLSYRIHCYYSQSSCSLRWKRHKNNMRDSSIVV